MNIVRTQVRNILLTLVVVCAFIIDARTARASTSPWPECMPAASSDAIAAGIRSDFPRSRSEEHTSELQSLMRISYAVFCLKKKKNSNFCTILTQNILNSSVTNNEQIDTKLQH